MFQLIEKLIGDHVPNKANQCSKEPNVIRAFFVAEQNVNTGVKRRRSGSVQCKGDKNEMELS